MDKKKYKRERERKKEKKKRTKTKQAGFFESGGWRTNQFQDYFTETPPPAENYYGVNNSYNKLFYLASSIVLKMNANF